MYDTVGVEKCFMFCNLVILRLFFGTRILLSKMNIISD